MSAREWSWRNGLEQGPDHVVVSGVGRIDRRLGLDHVIRVTDVRGYLVGNR